MFVVPKEISGVHSLSGYLNIPERTELQPFSLFSNQWVLHLFMKQGSLSCFVLYLRDPKNWGTSDHVLCTFGKLLTRRGASAWFMTFGLVV
jgi:hypothetical protein